jgi:hypothetical protein
MSYYYTNALPPPIPGDAVYSNLLCSSGLSSFYGPTNFYGPVTIYSTSPVVITGTLSVGALVVSGPTSLVGLASVGSVSASGTVTAGKLVSTGSADLGTTAGSTVKVGSGSGDLVGFFGKTPIVQPTTAITASSITVGSSTSLTIDSTIGGYSIGQIVNALSNLGLLA